MTLVRQSSDSDKLLRRTLDYYECNAERYSSATLDADLSCLYQAFLRSLPKGARILDAGSGSGRDSLAFLRQGYNVSAFDASLALCRLSEQLTGVSTREIQFQDFEGCKEYDGIWACASLLHVPIAELPASIFRLICALKPGGVMYMSFKHGSGERVASDGRFYTDLTSDGLRVLINEISGIWIRKIWTSSGVDGFGCPTLWVNALVSPRP